MAVIMVYLIAFTHVRPKNYLALIYKSITELSAQEGTVGKIYCNPHDLESEGKNRKRLSSVISGMLVAVRTVSRGPRS